MQGQGGQQGEGQIEARAARPQGGQLGQDAGGYRRAAQQQAGDLEGQEAAPQPDGPGVGFHAGPAVMLRPLQGLRAGQALKPLVLGRPPGLGIGLLRLPEGALALPDLLVQHFEILQFPLGPAQGLPVGKGAVPLLRLQGGQGLPGGLAVGRAAAYRSSSARRASSLWAASRAASSSRRPSSRSRSPSRPASRAVTSSSRVWASRTWASSPSSRGSPPRCG